MRKILLIVFLGFVQTLFSQEYKFNVYTQENGLPQPYVYDIIQAKNGFLFVATGDGLSSYGGQRFNKFSKNVGLSENFCNSLFSDSQNRIWIGHFEGGISCLENNVFRKLNTSSTQSAKVLAIAEDSQHNIYYINSAGSIYQIKNDSIIPFLVDELPPAFELRIKNNIMFVASQEGLLSLDLASKTKKFKVIGNTENKTVTCFEINNNEIYAGIDGIGIELIRKDGQEFKSIKTFSSEIKSKKLNIKDICLKNNELWVSLTNEGLSVLYLNNLIQVEKQLTINRKNGLPSVFVSKIFVGKEENVWLGTIGAGLSQFISAKFQLFNSKNFLEFDNILTVAVDENNNTFLTNEKDLFVFNPADSTRFLLNVVPYSNEEEDIRCSYIEKSKNELWIGTSNNLYVYDINKGKPKWKATLKEFKGKAINFISKDNIGQYLVCTIEGLFYLNEKKNLIKEFNTDNGAPHNNFKALYVDQVDRYWIFSPETPLYNLYNNEITLEKELDSTTSFRFSSGTMDKKDMMWFGTEGDGVYSYTKNRKPRYIRYNTNNGLASDYIYGIISTNNGDVITCHKNGISIKYSNLKTFRAINKSNGLPATNINNNAVTKDKNGFIWFGTNEGVIKYDPNQDKINFSPPILSITSLTFNDSIRDPRDTVFEFEYGKYELIIKVIGVSLTNPDAVSYKFKLIGLEDKWRNSDERLISYPGLKDGEYRFMIYSKNGDGFENPNPLTFRFIIKKPIWKNPIFYILLVGIITAALVLFFRARTAKLKREKIYLEEMVTEKTKEVVIEKERVEQANELLQEKNRDITDSITYAKRIQSAVLPQMENIYNHLDLFILYKPRDIVSGDFYWYYTSPNYFYIAVVDCTGHGVPGAFMSLLGSTYLDQIMIEKKEPIPRDILIGLDKKINAAFKQSNPDNKIGDGMDMSLCRITRDYSEIVIASANRPIYYYHKSELIEKKANVFSIGGYFDTSEKDYTQVSFSITKGDVFYMFSDGYSDQFGGPKNRRFSTRKLKVILNKIHTESTKYQNEVLDQEFVKWRGTHEQIDDICVVGIKF